MTAVVLVLVLVITAATAGVVGWVARRRRDSLASGAVAEVAPTPQRGCRDVESLDDGAFREWLGVLPAVFDRYVDTGVEDLEIFLADQPARHGGEDPA
jgi:hypothetical protein